MQVDEYKLARRIASLPGEQRRALLKRIAAQGIDIPQLPIVSYRRNEPLPLSYAQQSLWLTWNLDPLSPAYNLRSAVSMNGPIDVSALEAATEDLAERHEILRSVIRGVVDGEPEQVVLSRAEGILQQLDLSGLSPGVRLEIAHERMREHALAPFDLTARPAWRVLLLRIDTHTYGYPSRFITSSPMAGRRRCSFAI